MSDCDSDYYDPDDPCNGRDCDMGHCEICGGNTSSYCLREGCNQDCSMEYEECACDCMRCGGIAESYKWCYCKNKERCKPGTMLKLGYFQAIWRGYSQRKVNKL